MSSAQPLAFELLVMSTAERQNCRGAVGVIQIADVDLRVSVWAAEAEKN
jgi:hypothetical protein